MNKFLITMCAAVALIATPALADDKPTDEQAAMIKKTLEAWGCSGGTMEVEAEGSGVLEAEDVTCKAGQYDFRMDKEGKVFAITKD